MREREDDSLLWDLIANNDDICFKTHSSEIEYRTDMKSLYG